MVGIVLAPPAELTTLLGQIDWLSSANLYFGKIQYFKLNKNSLRNDNLQ